MARFFFIAAAASVLVADAVVYTFKDVQSKKTPCLVLLRTLHINGPSMVNVDGFSWQVVGNHPTVGGRAAVVIARVGTDLTKATSCIEGANDLQDPSLDKSFRSQQTTVTMSPVSGVGTVTSHKMAVREAGAYSLYFIDCSKEVVQLSAKISGPGLDAHENGWAFNYAIGALVYAGLFVVLKKIQSGANEKHAALLSDVVVSSAFLLATACSGFVLHALPEKNATGPRIIFTGLSCGAMTSLMTTFFAVTALGRDVQSLKVNFVLFLFFFLFCAFPALTYSEWAYEKACEDIECVSQTQTFSILLPLITAYGVLGLSGFIRLRSSIGFFRQNDSDGGVTLCLQLYAALTIYVALGILSAWARSHDVPSVQPGCWTFHFVADIIGNFTQLFGLVAVTYIIGKGIPENIIGGDSKISYRVVDEETSVESDDETSPIVYGNVI